MGFFSSRRPDNDYNPDSSERVTVVQVIRSRFYGKHKGKEPEQPQTTFISQNATTAQTLSIPISNNHVRKSHSTTFSGAKDTSSTPSRSFSLNDRFKSTRAKASPSADTTPNKMAGTSSATSPNLASSSKSGSEKETTIASPTPRKATDTATMSLAQRLNELAVANSEGLLNDDEYRILRQNLFERFASNAAVPTENPVVPATPSRPSHLRGNSTTSDGRASSISRPASQFIVEVPRSPSIRSRNSVRSGVAGLFQRATGHHKQQSSRDYSDTSSVWSGTSTASQFFRSPLNKKSSSASVRSATSHQTDAISISSRKTGLGSERDYGLLPPQTPRSTAGSIRRLQTPPSSFHSRSILNENKFSGDVHNVFDDDNLKSSQDIKREIAAVEAEGRRLMDAFNGLEVTILSKRQRHPNARPTRIVELAAGDTSGDQDSIRHGSTWTLTPDHKLALKVDSDGASIRSGTSVGTSPSISRSMYLKTLPSKGSSSLMSMSTSHSRPGSLHRKNSSSSMASSRAGGTAPRSRIPPVPALPNNMGQYLGHASSSSLNLTRSTGHLPMRSVPEDEVKSVGDDSVREMDTDMDAEMEEIRRRREDVSKRYEARVEYLKAKLKGAQLHEKLMKK